MKNYLIQTMISACVICLTLAGCSDSDSGSDDSDNGTVACNMASYNQCYIEINLSDASVASSESDCVDNSGTVIESCSTDNQIGSCEELDDPAGSPDRITYFYSPATESAKEQLCTDAGGVWKSAN